ncbi:hypothetical protein [Corallococcus silvisoli]|uniref:hypothetical protein n=1 Tax=Corallococcus silvisoli TaxID=2697031 RepID=UPI001F2E7442|nr:hypothetical protein [Corallococcus silvisoli]
MRVVVAVAVLAAVLGPLPVLAAAPVEPGKVFVGPQGEQVAVVPLAPREEKKFILRIQGTGSVLDTLVLPYTLKDWSSLSTQRHSYTTQWHGKDYSPLIIVGTRAELHFPGGPGNGVAVQYDEARSQKLKPEEVYAQHQQQTQSGQLAKLMAFDRKAEESVHDTAYAEVLQAMNTSCGTSVAGAIDWATISEPVLKAQDIARFCAFPLNALKAMCEVSEEARGAVKARLQHLDCRFGAALEPALQGDRFVWTTSPEVSNQQKAATRYFKKQLPVAALLVASPATAVEPSWGKAENLGQRMLLEATPVCTDGKGHYVAAVPYEETDGLEDRLYYGDGKAFFEVPRPRGGNLSAMTFMDPRFFNPKGSPDYDGLDLRVHSALSVDPQERTCSLRCGERKVSLEMIPGTEARELLRKATYAPNPQKFVPHALLRDSKGTYYYVDKGFTPSEARNFRVFIGPRGDLKPQKMTNVVADSEGEIFTTKKGQLRLVIDRAQTPMWIENPRTEVELRNVPVGQNLPLIYNELGVYTGLRLGTPCDDQ